MIPRNNAEDTTVGKEKEGFQKRQRGLIIVAIISSTLKQNEITLFINQYATCQIFFLNQESKILYCFH